MMVHPKFDVSKYKYQEKSRVSFTEQDQRDLNSYMNMSIRELMVKKTFEDDMRAHGHSHGAVNFQELAKNQLILDIKMQ